MAMKLWNVTLRSEFVEAFGSEAGHSVAAWEVICKALLAARLASISLCKHNVESFCSFSAGLVFFALCFGARVLFVCFLFWPFGDSTWKNCTS